MPIIAGIIIRTIDFGKLRGSEYSSGSPSGVVFLLP
jgi:hypothetical protein